MTLIKWRKGWDVSDDVLELQNEINRLFDSSFSYGNMISGLMEGEVQVPVNIYHDKDNLYVISEVPGVERSDLEVTVKQDTLTIKGARKRTGKEEAGRNEISFGTFQRTLTLPCRVESDKTAAVLKDGLLELTLPKKEEAKEKSISVKID